MTIPSGTCVLRMAAAVKENLIVPRRFRFNNHHQHVWRLKQLKEWTKPEYRVGHARDRRRIEGIIGKAPAQNFLRFRQQIGFIRFDSSGSPPDSGEIRLSPGSSRRWAFGRRGLIELCDPAVD